MPSDFFSDFRTVLDSCSDSFFNFKFFELSFSLADASSENERATIKSKKTCVFISNSKSLNQGTTILRSTDDSPTVFIFPPGTFFGGIGKIQSNPCQVFQNDGSHSNLPYPHGSSGILDLQTFPSTQSEEESNANKTKSANAFTTRNSISKYFQLARIR